MLERQRSLLVEFSSASATHQRGSVLKFSTASRPTVSKKIVEPIKLFERRPSLPGTPNDIWRGQTEALETWHENRTASDVFIALNTGAGKTLVGLLIAQSLVNEGVGNVLYLCSTIDLVHQTRREAEKLGIKCTARVEGSFNNDLFERGRSFCITTYSALFNGLSMLRRRYPPGAVVFDDAHVAEKIMRDSFTLKIDWQDHRELFQTIRELLEPGFHEAGKAETLDDAITGRVPLVLMGPPSAVLGCTQQLAAALRRAGVPDDDKLKYAYHHLKENIADCSIIFSKGMIEIAPPFLPVLALDTFANSSVRRVYLSATLKHRSDFARAFGGIPKIVIEPKNDAGNGERLVLFGVYLPDGEIDGNLVERIVTKHKIVIAVPSFGRAKAGRGLASRQTGRSSPRSWKGSAKPRKGLSSSSHG
jgi:hypothetical protein